MSAQVLQALNKWKRRAFEYGDADCVQFANFITKELTGRDYLRDFTYSTEEQANAIIDKEGDLEDTVTAILGESTENVSELPDGSPVIIKFPAGQLMGIKLGDEAICLTLKGFSRIPENYIAAGWVLCRQ
tara:strand:+ start:1505 stop:1894 length:390 start_codon:yes stop_codon:yes gene_type:complete